MLPESARAIMRIPHPSGRAAMRMLEQEGFSGGSYVDIFDGGPTMAAATDSIRTVREARELALGAIADGGRRMMIAAGSRGRFASGYGHVAIADDGMATLDRAAANLIGIAPGDRFLAVSR
jgi:arginine N-succinyltransferase